ncbi:hypothetical protein KI387_042480, partial [Taxus chinensis]
MRPLIMGYVRLALPVVPRVMITIMRSAQMEACAEGVFMEDSVVVVTAEEEGVSSCVEPVSIVGLQSITNENAQTCCSAHGVERSI